MPAHLEGEADVLLDRQPGEEGVLLEHDAAVGAGTLDELSVAVDLAAGGLEQSGDNIQQGALAAAGGSDDADELVVVDVKRHAVEGNHLTVAAVELLDDVVRYAPLQARLRYS